MVAIKETTRTILVIIVFLTLDRKKGWHKQGFPLARRECARANSTSHDQHVISFITILLILVSPNASCTGVREQIKKTAVPAARVAPRGGGLSKIFS